MCLDHRSKCWPVHWWGNIQDVSLVWVDKFSHRKMLNYPRIVWSQHNVLQHHQLYNMEVEIIPKCGQPNDLFLWSKFQQLLFLSCGQLQQPTLYFAHWPYCTHIGVCTCICAKIDEKVVRKSTKKCSHCGNYRNLLSRIFDKKIRERNGFTRQISKRVDFTKYYWLK